MGRLTEESPKALIALDRRTILERTLELLPESIGEAIVVVRYRGEEIRKHIGPKRGKLRLRYVEQEGEGTGSALWSAREAVGEERFLAINGDDVYRAGDVARCLERPLACAIFTTHARGSMTEMLHVETDEKGRMRGVRELTDAERQGKSGVNIPTGLYVLDARVFEEGPLKADSGEASVPHTVARLAERAEVWATSSKSWLPINTPMELSLARERIAVTG
jgi:NDP-sugar pyrophosphorylase family protein